MIFSRLFYLIGCGWLTLMTTFFFYSPIVFAGSEQSVSDTVNTELNSDAAKTVLAFHEALKNSEGEKVLSLLAEDVHIYEGHGVERSASEYASHHMLSDMAFLSSLELTKLEHQVKVFGDTAFSVSRTKMEGDFRGKAINMISVETLVLRRFENSWRILHIHWSNS